MLGALAKKLFGSSNDRRVKGYQPRVAAINALETEIAALSDEALKARTEEFKKQIAEGKKLDDLLVPAFATVREAAKRVLGQRPYDVQLVGGMVLHEGAIAEMKTGEGKTLVATLPTYLNALEGKGVHVVTVNDYLARRDAEWMAKLYNFLGLTVGIIVHGLDDEERQRAYACDITYGTNNEFGFDYLRDNMKYDVAQMSQRGHHFAIVDEVDSILVDEARTPLIISGPLDDKSDLYVSIDKVLPGLVPTDYEVDEKQRTVALTEAGNDHIEELLREAGILKEGDLYDAHNVTLVHHVNQALRAHSLFTRDKDYIVRDDEVVIIDEFTGRMMQGRRYSEGLHQALEAKEHVTVQPENQTLASITFQNYFRMYKKLAGMTGTADTEAYEFQSIYGLEVIVIPTNRPAQRKDHSDQVFLNRNGKYRAVLAEIQASHERGQPVLVGTTSIEVSEMLSQQLKAAGVHHEVLNAKQHEREANIIAQAGRPGAITIATNMAGRGTDIVLGGSLESELAELAAQNNGEPVDEVTHKRLKAEWQQRHDAVKAAGGLHIVGTERHESRRIDNQLRGRAGRQGDPGSSRFYLSLEDNLMRIFAADWVQKVMARMGLKEDDIIESPLVTKQIANAQRKVEAHNFDIRKNLLDFDDVNNDQRKVIYGQRDELLEAESVQENVDGIRGDVVAEIVQRHVPADSVDDQWDLPGLQATLASEFGVQVPLVETAAKAEELDAEAVARQVHEAVEGHFAAREQQLGAETMRMLEKHIMLNVLDQNWKEHLARMDYLRQGIHLRGYAQKQPKQEYKKEAFELFSEMLDKVKREVVTILARVRIQSEEEIAALEQQERAQAEAQLGQMQFQHASAGGYGADEEAEQVLSDEAFANVGRNDPCPCGSGKKYKHCHGQLG